MYNKIQIYKYNNNNNNITTTTTTTTTTHTHTHTHLTALFQGLPGWADTRKVKPIWILLKQETVSGSGISWDIRKSATRSRQITTPTPHHWVFLQAGCLSCCPTNSVKALKANYSYYYYYYNTRLTAFFQNNLGKPASDLNEARDDWVLGWHMQTSCTSLQTDNHTNTSSLNFDRSDALTQHCQSMEGWNVQVRKQTK